MYQPSSILYFNFCTSSGDKARTLFGALKFASLCASKGLMTGKEAEVLAEPAIND